MTAKHPDHVEGWTGSLQELAAAIGNMRYDNLAEFLGLFSENIREQGATDLKNNKYLLATKLSLAACSLNQAKDDMDAAWKICKPYIKD